MFGLKHFIRTAASASLLANLCVLSFDVAAQGWPTRAVTVIVPYPPGGPSDVVARTAAPVMQQKWDKPVVVENRAGAGGVVGTAEVARARPDGYTMLFHSNGVLLSQLFQKSLPYEPADLRPVVLLASTSYVIVTNPAFPAKSMTELVAQAKARPKSINYGTLPNTPFDIDYGLLEQKAGMQMTNVPYNGAVALAEALMRNDIQMYFGTPGAIAQLVKGGKLVPLGATGASRHVLFPEVPTLREMGIDFTAGFGFGMWVPSKTPDDAVNAIGTDFSSVLQNQAFGNKLKEYGYEVPARPRQWPDELQVELKNYTAAAQRLGIKPQ